MKGRGERNCADLLVLAIFLVGVFVHAVIIPLNDFGAVFFYFCRVFPYSNLICFVILQEVVFAWSEYLRSDEDHFISSVVR